MRISPIGSNSPIASVTEVSPAKAGSEAGEGVSFKSLVKDAIGEVNHLQNHADQLAVKVASGDIEDVHQAMIAMQKAKLALDLTIQVRNKVIDAYTEIMRMQV